MPKKATRKEDEPNTSGLGALPQKQTKARKGAKEPALPLTKSTLVRAAKTKAIASMSNIFKDKNYINIDVEESKKRKTESKAVLKKSISTDNLLSINISRRLRRSKSAETVSHQSAAPSAKINKRATTAVTKARIKKAGAIRKMSISTDNLSLNVPSRLRRSKSAEDISHEGAAPSARRDKQAATKARTKKAGTESKEDGEEEPKRRTAKKAETEVAPEATTKAVPPRGRGKVLPESQVIVKSAKGRGGKAAKKEQSSTLPTKAQDQTTKMPASNKPRSRKAAQTADPEVEPDQHGAEEPMQTEDAGSGDDVQMLSSLLQIKIE